MVSILWVLQLSNPVMIKRRRETIAVLDKVKDWNITFFCRVTIFISTALHIAAESNLKDPHCHSWKNHHLKTYNMQTIQSTSSYFPKPKIFGLMDGSEKGKISLGILQDNRSSCCNSETRTKLRSSFPSMETKNLTPTRKKKNPIDDKGERERKAESSLFIVQGAGFHQRLKYW